MRHWRAFATICLSSSTKRAMKISCNHERPTLRGVVFDMDGTLTVPNLDFAKMYRDCGVEEGRDILRVLGSLPPGEAAPKWAVVEAVEDEGIRALQIMPGAREVLQWLRRPPHQIPIALVTRNTLRSARALEERLGGSSDRNEPFFDIIVSRDSQHHRVGVNDNDDGSSSCSTLPSKPDPAALHMICQRWNVSDASQVIMVGDSNANDVVFGKLAGTATALLDPSLSESVASDADIVVQHLHELPSRLWHHFEIQSDLGTNVPLLKYDAPLFPSALLGDWDDSGSALGNDMDVSQADATGNAPLIWAADRGRDDLVRQLLSRMATPTDLKWLDHRGYLGATAACRAARRGHASILRTLLEAGADPDIPNSKLQFPLHFAAFQEHMDSVRVLLEHGANTRVLDRKGRIPAEDTKNDDIRAIILAAMEQKLNN